MMRFFYALCLAFSLTACDASPTHSSYTRHADEPGYALVVAASTLRQERYPETVRLVDAALATGHLTSREVGFAHMLRADASLHAGQPAEASKDIDALEKASGRERSQKDASSSGGGVDGAALSESDGLIAAHPNNLDGYFRRARVLLDQGKAAAALIDCDIAVELDLATVAAWDQRHAAWKYFEAGQFAAVIDELRGYPVKTEIDPDSILLLHLANAKLGRDDHEEFDRSVAQAGGTEWPAPVLAFYQGKIDRERLLAAASDGPDRNTRAEQRCNARFHAGEYAVLHGRDEDGRTDLEDAQKDCPFNADEIKAATAELRRLK